MPKLPTLSEDAKLPDLFAAFPQHAGHLISLVDAVMRDSGEWDIAEREFIAAYVSGLNACTFCLGSHVVFAEAFGLPETLLEAALDDPLTADLAPKLAAVLIYIRKMNTLPHKAVQADLDQVLAAGVCEAAVYEALMIAGLFNMMNRIVEGSGVTFDFRTDPSQHSTAGLTDNPRVHRYAATRQDSR